MGERERDRQRKIERDRQTERATCKKSEGFTDNEKKREEGRYTAWLRVRQEGKWEMRDRGGE